MANDNKPRNDADVPEKLAKIGSGLEGMDLSSLTEEQRQELTIMAAKSNIEFTQRAKELGLDATALQANLQSMNEATRQAAEAQTSATISNTRDDTLGRTEIIMGNTEKAREGKLSRTQTGAPDRTVLYLIAGVILVIIVAVVVVKVSG